MSKQSDAADAKVDAAEAKTVHAAEVKADAKAATEITESLQWDGTTDPAQWPIWLAKNNAIANDDHIRLNAADGVFVTAKKGEWIHQDSRGHLHVAKAAPPKKMETFAGKSAPAAH